MRTLGIPRRTAALIGANSLSAAVQGQFQFVLPWMLLTRGHSPQAAALAAGLVYVPLLLTAVPGGRDLRQRRPAPADAHRDRRHARRRAPLYPLAALAGHDWFVLVLVAAVVVGLDAQLLGGGALPRHRRHDARADGLLRAHAVRTTVNQAAVFGSPFVGLLLFRVGGVDGGPASGSARCSSRALVILGFVPELERGSESVGGDARERRGRRSHRCGPTAACGRSAG